MSGVIIIGGGYSVKEEWENGLFDKIKDKGYEIWSLNFAFKTMPYLPDRQLFVDRSFFEGYKDELNDLAEKGVPITCKKHNKYAFIKEIECLDTYKEPEKFDIESSQIYTGNMGLVGFFALSYSIQKGFKNIFLLGYDFGSPDITDTKTHYYQEEQSKLNITSRGAGRPSIYRNIGTNELKKYIKDFEVYKKVKDANIYNVSMRSNIDTFPKITYEKFYEIIRG